MHLARFQFRPSVYWRLSEDDPDTFALPQAVGWRLLNPRLYPGLVPTASDCHFFLVGRGQVFGFSSEVVLATYDLATAEAGATLSGAAVLFELVGDLFFKLRHLSAQATIPRRGSIAACAFDELGELPKSAGLSESSGAVQRYLWETSVTAEHILAAAGLAPDFVPPAHEAVLLDGISAYQGGDYRSAILLAAVSAEAAFGSVIDREYSRIVGAAGDERFRVISIPEAGGGVKHKDPVYQRLRRRRDMATLMHELALYVLRRSVLVENQTLYQNARRLYLTRNGIVHTGGDVREVAGEPFPLDQVGAMAGLETAVALLSWLGERADIPLPKLSLVRYGNSG